MSFKRYDGATVLKAKKLADELSGFTNKDISIIINGRTTVNNNNRDNIICEIISNEFGNDILMYKIYERKSNVY